MTIHTDPGEQPVGSRKRRPNPGPTRDADDLFSQPVLETPTREIVGMVRGTDSLTAQRAAVDVLPKLSKLERRIMELVTFRGPEYEPEGMTDREIETLREFAHYGPSTVRRRRTTLFQQGRLVENGVRDKLTIWRVAPRQPDGR